MRKLLMAAAITALATQAALPALAASALDPSGPQGWRRSNGPSAVAYFRMPLQSPDAQQQPRLGVKLVAPRSYGLRESPVLALNPTLVDVAFTGRSFNAPWTATVALGNRTAWAADPTALPKGARLGFIEDSGVSWIIIGALTVAAGIGIFAIIDDPVPPPANAP